jgi:predicted nucleic acid-binding protein
LGQAPGFVTLPDDGRIYLFDTSIWSHTEHPQIASDWTAMLRNDRIAVSPVVAFEVLYTAQNQADFEDLEEQLDALRQVPLTQGIVRSARAALHTLSATNHHRLPFQDASRTRAESARPAPALLDRSCPASAREASTARRLW